MLKQIIMRKVAIGLIVCGASLFSVHCQSAIIASYDAGVDIGISSTFLTSEFETEFYDADLFVEGSASGDTSGSGDSITGILGAGEIASIGATADGAVTGGDGFAGSYWEVDGYFYIDNEIGLDSIIGDVSFDISWFANIFTDTGDEEAVAGVEVYIEDSYENIIFDDFIGFDNLVDGISAFSFADMFTVDVMGLTIAAGDYEEYYLEISVGGFAESVRAAIDVPEPAGVFLAGLTLLIIARKRKMS